MNFLSMRISASCFCNGNCFLAVLWLIVIVLCLFLAMPWVGLWSVIVAFPQVILTYFFTAPEDSF